MQQFISVGLATPQAGRQASSLPFLPLWDSYDSYLTSAQITLSLWARAFLPLLSRNTIKSLPALARSLAPIVSSWSCVTSCWGRSKVRGFVVEQESFSKRKAEPEERGSFHIQTDFELPASLCGTVSNFLPSQLLLTHGWMASSILCAHCSASVCLSTKRRASRTLQLINMCQHLVQARLLSLPQNERDGTATEPPEGLILPGAQHSSFPLAASRSGGQEGITGFS